MNKQRTIICWQTGCVVAASRIMFENWSVEDTITELMQPQYGHRKRIYTNIPELLRKARLAENQNHDLEKGTVML